MHAVGSRAWWPATRWATATAGRTIRYRVRARWEREPEFEFTTWGSTEVLLKAVYRIPGRGERLFVFAFTGDRSEGGYETQVPVIVRPGETGLRQVGGARGAVTGTLRVEKPVRAAGEPPLFLHELIAAAAPGARVLDAGCGPGSWPYGERPDLRITGFDIKFPPGPPARREGVDVLRASLERLPLRAGAFDLVVCHYVLEHVTELEACCDELARMVGPGGTLYVAVPRAAAFDDRLYRFAGYFAKYALLKFGKRIEHQQRFDLRRAARAVRPPRLRARSPAPSSRPASRG